MKIKVCDCGLYYKHVMIVNDNSSIISKQSFKLIDNPRVIIYDRHRFILPATGLSQNIRFGWLGLSGINTLARSVIKLYKLGPECYFTTVIKA
jgi:hypothetical protein